LKVNKFLRISFNQEALALRTEEGSGDYFGTQPLFRISAGNVNKFFFNELWLQEWK